MFEASKLEIGLKGDVDGLMKAIAVYIVEYMGDTLSCVKKVSFALFSTAYQNKVCKTKAAKFDVDIMEELIRKYMPHNKATMFGVFGADAHISYWTMISMAWKQRRQSRVCQIMEHMQCF